MTAYTVLIVDNQRKQRRELRSAIESLGGAFKVTEASSGEEALLLVSRQPVHLLVSEFRLAGMSGLELLKKVRQSQPAAKTIVISEPGQTNLETQASQLGADAFFLKPVDTAEFLKAVTKCLSLVQVEPASIPETKAQPPLALKGLPEVLETLRQQLHGIAVLLMDREGRVAIRAGDLPPEVTDSSLPAALKAAFEAGVKVSWALGKLPPQDLSYFSGAKFDLYLAHVGQSTALVALTEPAREAEARARVILQIPAAVNALLRGFSTKDRLPYPPAGLTSPDTPLEGSLVDPGLDLLLSQASSPELDTADLDLFWETAADQAAQEGVDKPGALSYEQARKLGLAPEEDVQG